jgi:HEAT repeat protein
MATCERWGHRAALPLIQRGLRDSDPAVVALAASAMGRFRGRSAAIQTTTQAVKPPRNVSRTR